MLFAICNICILRTYTNTGPTTEETLGDLLLGPRLLDRVRICIDTINAFSKL